MLNPMPMKVLIVAAALTAAPTIQAQEPAQQAQKEQKTQAEREAQAKKEANAVMCESFESLAGTIMSNRQMGVELSKMMNATATLSASPEVEAFFKRMVIEAYQEPAYGSEEYQAKAISEFKTKVAVECYKTSLEE